MKCRKLVCDQTMLMTISGYRGKLTEVNIGGNWFLKQIVTNPLSKLKHLLELYFDDDAYSLEDEETQWSEG